MNKEVERQSAERIFGQRRPSIWDASSASAHEKSLFSKYDIWNYWNPYVQLFVYKRDINLFSKANGHRFRYAGMGKGSRVLFVFALGIYATTMTIWGVRRIGALPIDIDARAGSEVILRMANITRPDYMLTTPSLCEYLVGQAPLVINKSVKI